MYKNLVKMQAEIKNAYKSKKGYGYNYAPLDEIIKETKPILEKYGFAILDSQELVDGVFIVTSTLIHESGEQLAVTSAMPFSSLKGMNDYQTSGSASTYGRRYNRANLFNMASDEDKDAHGEQETKKAFLTESQKDELDELLANTDTDRAKFFKFYKCSNLDDFDSKFFTQAIKALKTKVK